MLRGRPLYDTDADRKYFVPPAEWDRLMRAIERDNNVLLAGPRGSGKTTLLRQVQLAMRRNDDATAFVDATAVPNALELAVRTKEALRGRPAAGEIVRTGVDAALATFAGDPSPPPAGASRALFSELESIGEAPESTILVDASGASDAVYGLFGRMRDTLWQMPHSWVVAVDEDETRAVLKPPAEAFFDTVLRLAPLPTNALIDLLHRRDLPEELDDRSLWEIAANAHGNARTALRAANAAVVSGRDPRETMTERSRLLEAAANLGRPHGLLMAELLDLGQGSPSDEVLLDRLGLTRGRVTALLRELLEAGLVEAGPDRPTGPGRPKTIYRPALEEVS
jgi:energy-coupling factor transporter ATP-binding protein EcfA2